MSARPGDPRTDMALGPSAVYNARPCDMRATPTVETSAFGARLKQLRLGAGLSQEALAERAGLSTDALSALERGPRGAVDTRIGVAATIGPVPPPPTPVLGRETEVAHARDLLQSGCVRLVTLTGPGGVGKTRLALAIVRVVETD